MQIIESYKFNNLNQARKTLKTVQDQYNLTNPYYRLCVDSLRSVVKALSKPNVICSRGFIPSNLII